jgi:hypothetical protein
MMTAVVSRLYYVSVQSWAASVIWTLPIIIVIIIIGVRGSVVVKAQRYKSEGRGFDSIT